MKTFRRLCGGIVLAAALSVHCGGDASANGTSVIANAASASYETSPGHAFTVFSNTVQITVASVAAMTVSPKEDAPQPASETFGAGLPITRTFTIANAGNVADAYVVTAATSGAGSITAVAFVQPDGTTTPAAVGTTISPLVLPGATIDVAVRIATAGVTAGAAFPIALTARSVGAGTANGPQSDSGRRWAVPAAPPAFTGPSGGKSPVLKTVDDSAGTQSQPGAAVTYRIRFRNDGAVAATDAALTDTMPSGVRVDGASVQLDGAPVAATLDGRTLHVALGTIAAGTTHVLTIPATIDAAAASGTSIVNTAWLDADGIATAVSTPASVLVGRSEVVFDALLGESRPVASATVTLLDPLTSKPLALDRALGSGSVNASNANPFVTGADGRYGFRIAVPPPGTTRTFDIIVRAAGYLDRKIEATLVPDRTGSLYTITLFALDGQPMAKPGTFALTMGTVRIADVFSLLGNVPLLAAKPIVVVKTADRNAAEAGDRVFYTVTFTSNAVTALGATTIADVPSAGLAYARGTASLDGFATEPLVHGRTLTWRLPSLVPGQKHTLVYACIVVPGAADGSTVANGVAVRAAIAGTEIVVASGSAKTGIVVHGGVFSDRSVITGRVYIAAAGHDRFTEGARGIASVRLYLESGESVTTDSYGRFSFRGVRPGMHVLRLDETSLPRGLRLAAGAIDDAHGAVRLLHGIFDEGLMHDVQFVLESVP